MTITTANIDIGDLPNDGTGDPLRTAFDKINENFAILEGLQPSGANGSFQFNNNGTPLGTGNFTYDTVTNSIGLSANINITGNSVSIGNTSHTISNLYVGNSSLRIGNIKVTESANTLTFPISVLPTNKASIAINNVTADGVVNAAGGVVAGNASISTLEVTTANNLSNQVIWQAPIETITTGTFTIRSAQNQSNNSQLGTLVLNKSSSNLSVNFTVSGTIFTGNVVTDYNADFGYGNVRVMVSPFPNAAITHQIDYKIVN